MFLVIEVKRRGGARIFMDKRRRGHGFHGFSRIREVKRRDGFGIVLELK